MEAVAFTCPSGKKSCTNSSKPKGKSFLKGSLAQGMLFWSIWPNPQLTFQEENLTCQDSWETGCWFEQFTYNSLYCLPNSKCSCLTVTCVSGSLEQLQERHCSCATRLQQDEESMGWRLHPNLWDHKHQGSAPPVFSCRRSAGHR